MPLDRDWGQHSDALVGQADPRGRLCVVGREGEKMSGKRGRRLSSLMILLFCIGLTGCGTFQTTPTPMQSGLELRPSVEDRDAGLVGMAPDLVLSQYDLLVVEPFGINHLEPTGEISPQDMQGYLHVKLLQRLQEAGVFKRILEGPASKVGEAGGSGKTLILRGVIAELDPGSRALRYFVGFGAGATKAQIESQFVELDTGRVVLTTADRRAAAFGVFGGDSRQYLTESLDEMAKGLTEFLKRVAKPKS